MKTLMILAVLLTASPALAHHHGTPENPHKIVREMMASSTTPQMVFISGGMGMAPGTFTNLERTWYGTPRFISPFELRGGLEVFTPDRIFSIGYLGRFGIMNYHDDFVLWSHHLMLAVDTNPNRTISLRIEAYPIGATTQLRDEHRPYVVAGLPNMGVGLKFNCKLFRIGPDLFWGWGGDMQIAITASWSGPL
ncbi:hypothetical protein KJ839_02560 [Patescibacteria group bacterium]|nr:hypothetical protein [Patescibacteria group bacterium]MBU1963214.1 hypothetical protein [Patescibacteria group bacterium]